MKIYNSVTELIGRTPLLKANNFAKLNEVKANIFAKLEYFNPAGSVKDRVAYEMIRDAELSGKLKRGGVIIEPTSGNTGIGLAAVAAARGYKVILTMPDSMSEERRKLIRAYGAEIVLTPGVEGMSGAVKKAKELSESIPSSMIAGQFTNRANPEAHQKTTGPEIWNDLDGNVDIFIAGVGTGGTLTGVGEYLKEKKPDVKIIAVEPASSPLLSEGRSGKHDIQGIGANFVPEALNTDVYDEIICVTTQEAFSAGRNFAASEGILVGISSGAALSAAVKIACRDENKDKDVVVLLPDTGERYLSTDYFGLE